MEGTTVNELESFYAYQENFRFETMSDDHLAFGISFLESHLDSLKMDFSKNIVRSNMLFRTECKNTYASGMASAAFARWHAVAHKQRHAKHLYAVSHIKLCEQVLGTYRKESESREKKISKYRHMNLKPGQI